MKVVAAAIMASGLIHTLPAPARHHNVMRDMRERGIDERPDEIQGFVLEDGSFVNRTAAARAAIAEGQIKELAYTATELFSEDLW